MSPNIVAIRDYPVGPSWPIPVEIGPFLAPLSHYANSVQLAVVDPSCYYDRASMSYNGELALGKCVSDVAGQAVTAMIINMGASNG